MGCKYIYWVLGLILLIYAQALNYPFIADDIVAIRDNKKLYDLVGSIKENPGGFAFTSTRFILGRIFGVNPAPYRAVNILYHLGSTFLIYKIASKHRKESGLIASAIFGLHPLAVESIVWISGGPYAMMVFWLLLSFYLLNSNRKYRTLLICGSYLMALSASPLATTFIPIILWWSVSIGSSKHLTRLLMVFIIIISSIYLLLFFGMIGSRVIYLQQNEGGVRGDNPLISIPLVIANYLLLFIFPVNLTIYHTELSYTISEIMGMMIITALIIWFTFSYRKKLPYVSFWTFWFIVGPGLTLIPTGLSWLIAERYSYLGLVGLSIVATTLLTNLRLTIFKNERFYTWIIFLLVLLSVQTSNRISDWSTESIFWEKTAKISPSSSNARLNMGVVHINRGELPAAESEILISLKINPNSSLAWYDLGEVYRLQDRLNDAIKSYEAALNKDNNLWLASRALAAIYMDKKEFDKAKYYANITETHKPDDPLNQKIINRLK